MTRPVRIKHALVSTLCAAIPFASFAGELEGTVLDQNGKPVAHAFVAATSHELQRTAEGQIVRHLGHSDEQGHFLLQGLPADSYRLTATAPDLGPAFLGKVAIPATGKVDNQILRMGGSAITIEGTVRVGAGALPEGTVAGAARINDDDDGDMFYTEVSNGHYRLSLSPGQYTFGAKAPGWTSSFVHKAIAATDKPARLDFKLFLENGSDPALSREILEMESVDQKVRFDWIQHQDDAHQKEMTTVDARNETRVKQILKQYGWPGAELIGMRGVNAFWTLVQHASPPVIKESLPGMKAAADRGELAWATVALSIDRDLMSDNKKQLYGSQVTGYANGNVELYPVEDEAHLDERRAKVGLGPIADYKTEMIKLYQPSAAK